jgi:hypothetical protein
VSFSTASTRCGHLGFGAAARASNAYWGKNGIEAAYRSAKWPNSCSEHKPARQPTHSGTSLGTLGIGESWEYPRPIDGRAHLSQKNSS